MLKEMDVSYSIDVTDSGINVLCDPALITESTKQPQTSGWKSEQQQQQRRFRKISAPASTNVTGCMVWFPRLLVRGIRRYSVVDEKQAISREISASSDEDTPPHQWPEDEEETDGENPPTCIQSLRRLEISGTSITPLGIHMILAASPIIAIVS